MLCTPLNHTGPKYYSDSDKDFHPEQCVRMRNNV
jgi:hypothetical protein